MSFTAQTKWADVSEHSGPLFGRYLVHVLDRTPALLTGLSWFSSVLSSKCWDTTLIRPQLLPSKSFPVHYSLFILTGTSNRKSCRQLFKTLRILPLQSQYVYSLLCLVANNMDLYQFISDIHNRNTRQGNNLNLYQPSAHLLLYQKGTYCMGIRVFNSLTLYLKQLYNNCKCFKLALKDFFVLSHILYIGRIFWTWKKNM
jgi:hypothetical protein